MQGRKEKAVLLYKNVHEAKTKLSMLEEARDYIKEVFSPGSTVHHKKFGKGTVSENTGEYIFVDFSDGESKKLGTYMAISNGILKSDRADYAGKIEGYIDVLRKNKSIEKELLFAEQELKPYIDYLD